jgi:hypothetical protein
MTLGSQRVGDKTSDVHVVLDQHDLRHVGRLSASRFLPIRLEETLTFR